MFITVSKSSDLLYNEIRTIIESARNSVAITVNAAMTEMYWQIGKKINDEVLGQKRAEYGKTVVATLSRQLQQEFGGTGFHVKNLRRMMQFAAVYDDHQKVVSVMRQLSWTHFIALIPIEDPLKRKFYEQMCINERWSVRMLRNRIDSMLYERTAISRLPDKTIERDLALLASEQKMTADLAFRDPYLLDFLGLKDTYSEKDLENAIISELQAFIVEMGSDFAFLARQKRITIDNEDYYMDLLFYHRRLRCLVVIDLKLGTFRAEDKGQMELYLNWLSENDMAEGENYPIGLILCAGKSEEHIRLMHLENSNIRVSEYMTKLPAMELMEDKLRLSIERAHIRIQNAETPLRNL